MSYWKLHPGLTTGTLGDHAGEHGLMLECVCGHGLRLDVSALGLGMPIAELRRRAKCIRCGSRQCLVVLAPEIVILNHQAHAVSEAWAKTKTGYNDR